MGETDRGSIEFIQGGLSTFAADPPQLSLVCHFLVCNRYETVPSADTSEILPNISCSGSLNSSPDIKKYQTLRDGLSPFGNGGGELAPRIPSCSSTLYFSELSSSRNAAAFPGCSSEDNGRCAVTEIRQLPSAGNVFVCVRGTRRMRR